MDPAPYPVNQGYPLPPNDLGIPAPYPTDLPQSKNLSLSNNNNNNNELSEILNVIINSPYVTIKQDIELAEIVTGCEFRNSYRVLLPDGRPVMRIKERTNFCHLQCDRMCACSFDFMSVNSNSVFYRLEREFSCPCCFWRLPNIFKLYESDSNFEIGDQRGVGRCLATYNAAKCICTNKITITEENSGKIFDLRSNFAMCFCQYFKKTYEADTQFGLWTIRKTMRGWKEALKEIVTDADTFHMPIPHDLARMQSSNEASSYVAIFLGACIAVDICYFETVGKRSHHNNY